MPLAEMDVAPVEVGRSLDRRRARPIGRAGSVRGLSPLGAPGVAVRERAWHFIGWGHDQHATHSCRDLLSALVTGVPPAPAGAHAVPSPGRGLVPLPRRFHLWKSMPAQVVLAPRAACPTI